MNTRVFNFDNGKFWEEKTILPAIQHGQFLVKTLKSLVSAGTETTCNRGNPGWPKGTHGYSNAGVVIEVGSEVMNYKVGDRVASLQVHTDYYIGNDSDTITCHKIPDGVSNAQAVFMTLGGIALHIVERAKISLGVPVVVVGQGTVGLLTQQLARIGGAGWIVAVDTNASRHETAKQFGANETIRPSSRELELVLSKHGLPAARAPIFIEVSGAAEACKWILDAAHLRSRVVLAGTYLKEISFNPFVFIEKELEVVGAHIPKCPDTTGLYYPYSKNFNYPFILGTIRSGKLKVDGISDGFIKPDGLIEFYRQAVDGTNKIKQPIIDWEE